MNVTLSLPSKLSLKILDKISGKYIHLFHELDLNQLNEILFQKKKERKH